MDYGIPTLLEFSDVSALARFCADNGFEFVEMNMTFPWFQMGAIDAEQIRTMKKRYGISFTIHLHDQVNPFEFSPELRRGSLENIRFAMELACELDMPRITMHLVAGTYSSINEKKTYLCEHCKDLYLDHVRAFTRIVEDNLKGHSPLLCIENTSGFQPFQQEAVELMLKSDQFGLTFDIGHSYKAGGSDEQFILAHADKLRHFHIHDCSIKANHLAFGAGGLDLPRYLNLAEKNDCSVVVEVKESGALLRSKAYLIEHSLW